MIRIIKHEAVPQTVSFEVRFSDGRSSVYFYWDDVASRRLSSDMLDSKQALEAAEAFARSERKKKSDENTRGELAKEKRPQRV